MSSRTVEIRIAPQAGAAVPAKPPLVSLEIVYQRELPPATGDESSSTVLESVRTQLDTGLAASVNLEQVLDGSSVEVRFLGGTGATRFLKVLAPAGGAAERVDLTESEITAITAPDPRPPLEIAFFGRPAQLVSIGSAQVAFEASQLQVAWLDRADWAANGLDQVLRVQAPTTLAIELSAPPAGQILALPWQRTHVGVDGRFESLLPRRSGVVWVWWLTGPHSALGAIDEDLSLAAATASRAVALPPFALPAAQPTGAENGHRAIPADVSEVELAENPDVYTEDPGAFCRPFQNPERVLGERAFNVIVRAEQPAISVEPSLRTQALTALEFEPVRALANERPSRFARLTEGREAREVAEAVEAEAGRVVRHVLPAAYLDLLRRASRTRTQLDAEHPLEWEGDASRYQAATVARGHILEFRARWRSNGYSLGTVASTLTLAPRQVRRIQKIRWERLERVRREELTGFTEGVVDEVARERDYEDTVQASLSEWSRGESEATMSAGAGGVGFALGGFVVGGGGVHSNASASSSQQGGRRTTASEEQRLRDAIRRFAESRRRLESVVVNEVSQEETVTGTVETVRNPNYGHSLTVIYYQILRHLKLQTEFAGVRECLFVPFALKPFNYARAYRWRESIRRGLRDRRFLPALTYLKDVASGFAGSRVPEGSRATHQIRHVSGSVYLKLGVERPKETDEGDYDDAQWQVIRLLLGAPAYEIYAQVIRRNDAARDPFFQAEYAPAIAAAWADSLQLFAGTTTAGNAVLPADFTLATRYLFNGVVRIDFSAPIAGSLTRQMLTSMRLRSTRSLPPGSTANVTGMSFTYQTDFHRRSVTVNTGTQDLIRPETGAVDTNGAPLSAPLDPWEAEDEQVEMRRAVDELAEHLNEHVEHYHKAIWWNMDRDRLFMLIDGFLAPGTDGMSVASVVERDPVAIVGNSLVYRVSPGSFLGLGDIKSPVQLHNYYAGSQLPGEPMYVSLPTDGLYAQAIMDECEALEEHFGSTDWVLSDKEPELGALAPELLASRVTEPQDGTPTPFPQTLINLQNAPEAPAPAGLEGVLAAVTRADAFRDMAGLAGTQANVRAGAETAAGLASSFGQQAVALRLAEMAAKAQATQSANQKLASIQKASEQQLVSPDEAQQHASKVLNDLHSPSVTSPPHEDRQLADAIRAASGSPGSTIEATTPEGQLRVSLASAQTVPLAQRCGFFDLSGGVIGEAAVRAAVVEAARAERDFWLAAGGGLVREDNNDRFGHLVRYWLAERQLIPFGSLTQIGTIAVDPATAYGQLLALGNIAVATITNEVRRVAADLVVGVDTTTPPNLVSLVEQALRDARESRRDRTAWSGVFINSTVRVAEFNLNLEGVTGGLEALLRLSPYGRHWEYTLEAHRRRFGCRQPDGSFDAACQRGGYHAFRPTERAPQEGDIIVQDRQADQIGSVWTFDRIPNLAGREMHGDIVVDVQPGFVETIGGNVTESVRRRRYPLDANGRLVVAREQRYVFESDAEVFPALPVVNNAAGLNDLSTGRIFALLSVVEECVTIPGQPMSSDSVLV